jgi:hypothetical protein
METHQNIIQRTQSHISTRPEPQNDWDSFLLTASIPKALKGYFPLLRTMISHHPETEVKEFAPEGNTLEALPSKQQISQRRGRPRKNKEAKEIQVQNMLHARSYRRHQSGNRWQNEEERSRVH